MLWAVFPIISQFFNTSSSYLQNYLADSAFPKKRAGAIVITHLPYMVIAMLVLFALFGRMVFVLPLENALGLILAGAINVIASAYYYKALQAGDTADVNIFSQISPIISLALGVLMLGEVVTPLQGIGFVLIMVAIMIVVFGGISLRERKKIDYKVAMLTVVAAFFSILSDIVMVYFIKGFTTDAALFARSFFFFELGSAMMIIVITICFPSWRKAVRTALFTGRRHSRNRLASIADNLACLLSEVFYKYGLLIVPVVAMMTVIGKVTSLFVSLFYTIFVGRLFPKFIHGKRLTHKDIIQYLIAAVFIVAGIICMN